jgi:hydrogenase nickel incorporation protein HypB
VFKTIEVKENILGRNEKDAETLRGELKRQGIFLLNLMSSPGSGKTTTLMGTIPELMMNWSVGVMEADIDSDVDARTVSGTGARVIQLHTGGMCHLTADMTRQGLDELGTDGLDIAFLENVGNLVCPAEFDTGALKYPLMFSIADVVLVNKIDVAQYFDFNMAALMERVVRLNSHAVVIPISARTGEGMNNWIDWLDRQTKLWKQQ